ncbi:MAG: hypothetical protein N2C14_08965 [Planctomycetales bacterium]
MFKMGFRETRKPLLGVAGNKKTASTICKLTATPPNPPSDNYITYISELN